MSAAVFDCPGRAQVLRVVARQGELGETLERDEGQQHASLTHCETR
jgi:hypothetical protein